MFGFTSGPCGCFSREQNQRYRSFFCGLCNCMRQSYGLPTRFLINRDSTFLALLAAAQSPAPPETAMTTCCNPFGKKRPLHQDGQHARFAAAVRICGLDAKLRDNEADETRLRRWMAKSGRQLFQTRIEKARAVLESTGFPADDISRRLFEQEEYERAAICRKSVDFDEIAEPTAQAFSAIMAHTATLSRQEQNAPPLLRTGRALGRLIYWADAFDDFDKDARRGQFNPFRITGAQTQNDCTSMIQDSMRREFSAIAESFGSLTLSHDQALAQGILMQRTPRRWEQALSLPAGVFSTQVKGTAEQEEEEPRSRRRRKKSNNCCSDCCDPCGSCCDCCDCCSKKSNRTLSCCDGCDTCHCCCSCD